MQKARDQPVGVMFLKLLAVVAAYTISLYVGLLFFGGWLIQALSEPGQFEKNYKVTFANTDQVQPKFGLSWTTLNENLDSLLGESGSTDLGPNASIVAARSRSKKKDYFFLTQDGGKTWLFAENPFACPTEVELSCSPRGLYKLGDGRIVVEYDIHTLIIERDLKTVSPLRHHLINGPVRASIQMRQPEGDWLLVSDVNSSTPESYPSSTRALFTRTNARSPWISTGINGTEMAAHLNGSIALFTASNDQSDNEFISLYSNDLSLIASTNIFTHHYPGRAHYEITLITTPDGDTMIYDSDIGYAIVANDGSQKCPAFSLKFGNVPRFLDGLLGISFMDLSTPWPYNAKIAASTDRGCSWKMLTLGPGVSQSIAFNSTQILVFVAPPYQLSLPPMAFLLDNKLALNQTSLPPWAKQ